MMGERGVTVDHSTLNRWVIKYAPEVEKQFRRCQRSVGRSWRLDETYVKIKGKSAYLYRAVDKEGHTIDFLLTPNRDRDAAESFLHKAIHIQGLPEKITIDKSGANTAAITHYNHTHKTDIVIRHSKYLNNRHCQLISLFVIYVRYTVACGLVGHSLSGLRLSVSRF
jgi:putative transposase